MTNRFILYKNLLFFAFLKISINSKFEIHKCHIFILFCSNTQIYTPRQFLRLQIGVVHTGSCCVLVQHVSMVKILAITPDHTRIFAPCLRAPPWWWWQCCWFTMAPPCHRSVAALSAGTLVLSGHTTTDAFRAAVTL